MSRCVELEFIYFAARGNIEVIAFKCKGIGLLRSGIGEYGSDAAVVVTHLNAYRCCYIQVALCVETHADYFVVFMQRVV